jgi:hypothetical protein
MAHLERRVRMRAPLAGHISFGVVADMESESSEPSGLLIAAVAGLTQEQRSANVIRYYRMLIDQLDRAIDDPSLAAVLSTVSDVSPEKRRQLLFANKQYVLIVLGHLIGVTARDEFLSALRVLSRNPLFREYWERTREQRRDLSEESLEAQIGMAVDAIVEERFDDLEEWRVEGPSVPPPSKPTK